MLMRGKSIDSIRLKGLSYLESSQILREDVITGGYVGSTAHGTYVPNDDPDGIDDKDVMLVYINPKNYYLGLGRDKDTRTYKIREWDVVGYELRKYIGLLLKCNPNVLSLLWLPDKYYVIGSNLGWVLRDQRDIFSSKVAYHSFTGYAHGQLKRMTNFKFEGYMGEKRKKLVEKYGYDTKNAAHLIRLLRMGIEFLTERKLFVEREDAPQLIEIKKGGWSLERIKEEADKLFKLAEEAYIRSTLPSTPDFDRAEALLVDSIAYYHDLDNTIDWQKVWRKS